MTLIKVKESERNKRKHEKDTCKNKGVQKRQLEKLNEIKAQSQPKVRDYQ